MGKKLKNVYFLNLCSLQQIFNMYLQKIMLRKKAIWEYFTLCAVIQSAHAKKDEGPSMAL